MTDLVALPGARYRRVNVVGTSSSGKTTFARELAARLGIPHVELDALHWGPNWTNATGEELRDRVAGAAGADAWVIDGNYSVSRDLVWSRAELVVWLDYPLRTVLRRYVIRTRRRIRANEETGPERAIVSDCRCTCWAGTACCGGSCPRTTGGAGSIRACWPVTPTSRRHACAPPQKPRRGWQRSDRNRARLRSASTRCRRGSARASRSAAVP